MPSAQDWRDLYRVFEALSVPAKDPIRAGYHPLGWGQCVTVPGDPPQQVWVAGGPCWVLEGARQDLLAAFTELLCHAAALLTGTSAWERWLEFLRVHRIGLADGETVSGFQLDLSGGLDMTKAPRVPYRVTLQQIADARQATMTASTWLAIGTLSCDAKTIALPAPPLAAPQPIHPTPVSSRTWSASQRRAEIDALLERLNRAHPGPRRFQRGDVWAFTKYGRRECERWQAADPTASDDCCGAIDRILGTPIPELLGLANERGLLR